MGGCGGLGRTPGGTDQGGRRRIRRRRLRRCIDRRRTRHRRAVATDAGPWAHPSRLSFPPRAGIRHWWASARRRVLHHYLSDRRIAGDDIYDVLFAVSVSTFCALRTGTNAEPTGTTVATPLATTHEVNIMEKAAAAARTHAHTSHERVVLAGLSEKHGHDQADDGVRRRRVSGHVDSR